MQLQASSARCSGMHGCSNLKSISCGTFRSYTHANPHGKQGKAVRKANRGSVGTYHALGKASGKAADLPSWERLSVHRPWKFHGKGWIGNGKGPLHGMPWAGWERVWSVRERKGSRRVGTIPSAPEQHTSQGVNVMRKHRTNCIRRSTHRAIEISQSRYLIFAMC